MKTKIYIYRGIAIQDDELDTNNLGGAWTLDVTYAYARAEELDKFNGNNSTVVLEGVISLDDVNKAQTFAQLFESSNEKEFEIVPEDGAEIEVIVMNHNTTCENSLCDRKYNIHNYIDIDETYAAPVEDIADYEEKFTRLLEKFDSIVE